MYTKIGELRHNRRRSCSCSCDAVVCAILIHLWGNGRDYARRPRSLAITLNFCHPHPYIAMYIVRLLIHHKIEEFSLILREDAPNHLQSNFCIDNKTQRYFRTWIMAALY